MGKTCPRIAAPPYCMGASLRELPLTPIPANVSSEFSPIVFLGAGTLFSALLSVPVFFLSAGDVMIKIAFLFFPLPHQPPYPLFIWKSLS